MRHILIILISILLLSSFVTSCEHNNGKGTQKNEDSSTYVGGFKEGKENAQGTFNNPNGSKYMGEQKINKSVASIKESVRLAEYGMGTLGVSFILFPEFYLSLFTNDLSIIKMGVGGLRVVGALQFLDAIGFVLMFALIGAGNTVFPAVVESVLTWFVVVLGTYVFGVVLNFGFVVPWFLFPIHMSLFAGIMVWKVQKGDWKKINL